MKSGFAKALIRVQNGRQADVVFREYLDTVDVVPSTRRDVELHMKVGAMLETHFTAHLHGTATPVSTPNGMELKRSLDPWEARTLSMLKQIGGG